jgi:hypothetical protein
MTNNRCFSSVGFVMASLLFLAHISNTSAATAKSTSSTVTEDELANIDKTLDQAKEQFRHQKYEGLAFPILNSLERLTASTKTDKVLFLILRSKIAMGRLIDGRHYLIPDEKTAVEAYHEKHKSEYTTFLSANYQDQVELKELISKYPKSPYVPEAAFLMATEEGSMGECEADVDCHIGRSIDAYLPYIQAYPGHSKNRLAIDHINRELERVTWDPQKNGLWEIYDLDATAVLLKKYYEVVKTIADPELRAEALYPLARIFISAGEFKLANSIYNDLESHNSKWRNARQQAAQLMFEFSKAESSSPTPTTLQEVNQEITKLNSPSESDRLAALDKFTTLSVPDHTLLFKLLLVLSDMAEHDSSADIRKQSIDAVKLHASSTSFYRAVIGYCLQHESDAKNRYHCANLVVTDPALEQTDLYSLTTFRDQIRSIIRETEGTTSRIDKIYSDNQWRRIEEARAGSEKAKQNAIAQGVDLEAYQELFSGQAQVHVIRLFGTDYKFIVKRIRPERVIPLWCLLMLLCGLMSYRNAINKNLDKRFWLIVGALTAPFTLLYIYFIPKKK